ncbi:hypothetical protein ACOMHN_018741 [Nucella lapillus]
MCLLKVGGNSNKRLGAMNKLTNVVHSGWMIKSPPEQKLQSPLKIFRAKWKQRFFVLHKPSGSLPDQYELSYYTSEQCSKKKGTIDLEQCEQIIESLDSEQYPYLLAIKTVCRSKVRTYYLATHTEEDMGTWVQCLCRVCSLKQEDSPFVYCVVSATDIPDNRLSLHALSSTSSATAASTGPTPPSPAVPVPNNTNTATTTTPSVRSASSASPSTSSQLPRIPTPHPSSSTSSTNSSSHPHPHPHPAPSTSPQSYVFLNECTTGKRSERYGRTDSVDSVPEYQAPPPPPAKRGLLAAAIEHESPRQSLHDDSVFDVYDHPPTAGGVEGEGKESADAPNTEGQDVTDGRKRGEFGGSEVSLEDEAFYKVPPSSNGQLPLLKAKRGSESSDVDLNLNLNATVPLLKPRRSPRSACSSLCDRPGSTATETYDVPPPRHVSTSSQEGTGVGGLNSCPPTPPLRPPKPHSLQAQSPYQNLPTSSSAGNSYDSNSLSAVPSAPAKQSTVPFRYDVPRSSPFVCPPRDPSVLDVAPPAPAPRSCGPSGGHAYLNTVPGMGTTPPTPSVPPLPDTYLPARDRDPTEGAEDLLYADMDGLLPPPAVAGHAKPPPSGDLAYADMGGGGEWGQESAGGQAPPPLAPRPSARSGAALPAAKGVDSDIWSNVRTKSFIRSQPSASPSLPARPPPPLEPRRVALPARTEFASSSEDEDDLSVDGNNTHHDLSVVRMSTVPAAPDIDTEPELKYLDLALDPDPSRPQATASHGTPTEYREIDFVKTQALQDTKKARDMKK